jgi:hypothetical protein
MSLVVEKILGTPYSAIRGIPIISTGIEYHLATGPKTFTEEELSDAVAAIQDPAVVGPRLKIGHKDPRFNDPETLPEFDGEPALGRVENLAIGNNGQSVYGDYVTFDWLANLIPLAYPGRSIEAGLGVDVNIIENHKTVTGHRYRMVLTAVSLLGVVWPGCSTLDDLPLLLSADGPPGLEVVTARGGGTTDLEAAMNIEDVRSRYYEFLDSEENADQKWWWIRGMRMGDLSEGQLIVDDDKGHLFRVPFDVSGDTVTFGDPSQVVTDYKEVPAQMAASIAAALGVGRGEGAIIYATRAESRPDTITTGGDMTRAELCASLGLPEDASDEQIQAATSRVMASSTAVVESTAESAEADAEEESDDSEGDAEDDAEGNGDDDEVQAGSRPRSVIVDAAAFEQMQRDAALARRHEEERVVAANEQICDTAIRDGRFPPSARASYLSQLNLPSARQSTIEFINSLQAGVIPVRERGTTGAAEEVSAGNAAGLPDDWFPESKKLRDKQIAVAAAARVLQDQHYGQPGVTV